MILSATRMCTLSTALLTGALMTRVVAAREAADTAGLMWTDAGPQTPDTYVAFRGTFTLGRDTQIELRTIASGWFTAWLDGECFLEGPDRFDPAHPQYQVTRLRLPAGRHVLAVQAHHLGVTTRMLMDMPAFLYARLLADGDDLPTAWTCTRLPGYAAQVRRINPQLGWIEWCDTRANPPDWQAPGFEDAAWAAPVPVTVPGLGELRPTTIGPMRRFVHPIEPVARGPLAELFGYERDDVAARFMLRDLACERLPAQGLWRRYDLGFVRLVRPRFVLDLPPGAVVEFACSEWLHQGRVTPCINLSAGASCNLDHYVARGGVQEFFPLTPKGGRFLEVHVLADPAKIRFVREEYVERSYFGPPVGAFRCGDELLERIWMTGVETFRSCAEDALVDNPTRERGQWTGDVVSVGMDINAAAWGDLRLCRRGLTQSAWCAREDGLVAGLCPGGPAYIPTYAAQWIDACLHYCELTGDRTLLEEMFPSGVGNLAAFEPFVRPEGLIDGAGWVFVDWGYVRGDGPIDPGMNFHYLSALRQMVRWCELLGRRGEQGRYRRQAADIEGVLRTWLGRQLAEGGWPAVGYHNAVLALRTGLVEPPRVSDCISFIKGHILDCFPNNPDAPRLSDPAVASRRLITPYFAHYAFPPLIENGQMDFVLDQYRRCWGFSLQDGRTTWLEVFDTRWSHCHQWAGCPTWQLSRYVLGLHPRMDLGPNHFVLRLIPGSLPGAEGTIPLPGDDGAVRVCWHRRPDGLHYRLASEAPLTLHLESPEGPVAVVQGVYETVLPADP